VFDAIQMMADKKTYGAALLVTRAERLVGISSPESDYPSAPGGL